MIEKVSIIVPTRNRYTKLVRMINSLPSPSGGKRTVEIDERKVSVELLIMCDKDAGSYKQLGKNQDILGINFLAVTKIHEGSVACRNVLIQYVEDALLYATDDITFHKNAIESAIASMDKHFPDGDGVIGFHQENASSYCPSGVALVGQKFLLRYPDKKLFCPQYKHFACQEINRLGIITDRIKVDFNAQIWHDHPAFYKASMDRTHREARRWRQHDLEISTARKKMNLTWGNE